MAGDSTRTMHLGAHFHPTGHHVAAWLSPDSQIDAGSNFSHYAELTRMAEDAAFDFIFLADIVAARDGNPKALSRWPQYMAFFEPLTLLSALASVTKHIGLVATATTSYSEPYNIARAYASLDHLSGGRAGWNVVTSSNPSTAYNFGRDQHFAHADRYERAREFITIVQGLWDSWDDDAFIRDRKSGVYYLADKLHHLNHRGKHYSVRGPLNISRPPQGYPVICQAGASEAGRELAAETAEIVFIVEQSLDKAREFRADLRRRAVRYGREPDSLKVMAGLSTVVGADEAEAARKHAFLESMIHPDVGRELLSAELGGIDLSHLPIEVPISVDQIPATTNASVTTLEAVRDLVRAERLTLRELYLRFAGARGSLAVSGSASRVADKMEEWFRSDAVDGFIVQPATLPGGLSDFISLVIPELRHRNLVRSQYRGTTLRDHLDLSRPPSRYGK